MNMLKIILISALILPLFGCCGPDSPEENSGYSDLSTVQPADWEYSRNLPGLGGGGGQGH